MVGELSKKIFFSFTLNTIKYYEKFIFITKTFPVETIFFPHLYTGFLEASVIPIHGLPGHSN